MKKKIIVNFLSARIGGGKKYAEDFLSFLNSEKDFTKDQEIVLFLSEPPKNPPRHCRIFVFQSLIVRHFAEQIFLPLFCYFQKADALFCTADRIPLFKTCFTVTLIRNANLYLNHRYESKLKDRIRIRILRLLTRWTIERSDSLIFVSRSIEKMVKNIFPDISTKSTVIPHGLDLYESILNQGKNPTPFSSYIFYPSSLYYYKNFEDLIKVLPKLKQGLVEGVVIAGNPVEPEYAAFLKELVQKLRLEKRVLFLQNMSRADIHQLYLHASLICICSKHESFGHPAFEGYIHGKPLILNHIDIFEEFFQTLSLQPEKQVYFYSSGDLEDLAQKVTQALSESSPPKRDPSEIGRPWNHCFQETFHFIKSSL